MEGPAAQSGTGRVETVARPAETRTPALFGLVAVLALLTLEMVRFSGPLLDSAYTRGGASLAALAAVLTYAAPGPAAALLLAGSSGGRPAVARRAARRRCAAGSPPAGRAGPAG